VPNVNEPGASASPDEYRASLIDDVIRRAVDDELLVMHYQPQVRILDAAIMGFEALMRLRTPLGELLAPQSFLSRANELGWLERFEHAALRMVCRQGADWNARGYRLQASLNVSSQRLHDLPAFEAVLDECLDESGLPADQLTLEVPAAPFIGAGDELEAGIGRLADRGVVISISDFGSDAAVVADLEALPIGEVKLDRRYLTGIPEEPSACAVFAAHAAAARSLGVRCVAEGVETAQQNVFLVAEDIELAQGYYYERPLPAASFYELIRQPTGVVNG